MKIVIMKHRKVVTSGDGEGRRGGCDLRKDAICKRLHYITNFYFPELSSEIVVSQSFIHGNFS
jgi:hypothetical protein